MVHAEVAGADPAALASLLAQRATMDVVSPVSGVVVDAAAEVGLLPPLGGRRERIGEPSFLQTRAFEGAQISSGQRAAPGAIERIRINREVLDQLLGMTTAKIDVRRDGGRLRPSDVPVLIDRDSLVQQLRDVSAQVAGVQAQLRNPQGVRSDVLGSYGATLDGITILTGRFNSVEWANVNTPSVDAITEFRVGIKGPLTTPIGGGIRSLNVALRNAQKHNLQNQIEFVECDLLPLAFCGNPQQYANGISHTPVLANHTSHIIFGDF